MSYPIARLEIVPEDFPFLQDVRGFDDDRLEDYAGAMETGAAAGVGRWRMAKRARAAGREVPLTCTCHPHIALQSTCSVVERASAAGG